MHNACVIELDFTGTVFQSDGDDAWHWVELDEDVSEAVERFSGGPSGGWASIKVTATVGHTTWNTSLFLSDADTYLLPLKATVRRAESIRDGDEVDIRVRL